MANEFRDRLEHVVLLASDLKREPVIATALAQTPGITDDQITAVAGGTRGRDYRNWLESLPPDRRNQEWARLGMNERGLAAAAGYDPMRPGADPQPAAVAPPERGGFGGFLDDIGDVVGTVKDAAWNAGASALHWAGAPLRAVQHVQRANIYLGQERGSQYNTLSAIGGWGAGVRGWIEGTGDWSRAWKATEFGEKTYDPRLLNQARATYDRATFDLAKRVAEGEDPNSIRNSAKTQEERDMFENMLHNPVLQDAVDTINGAKFSIGRSIAQDLGIDPKSRWFTAISGTADATNALFLDPLLAGGKVAKVVQNARYGIAGASLSRIDELFEGGSKLTVAGRATPIPVGGASNVRRFWDDALPEVNAIIGRDKDRIGTAFEQLQTNFKPVLPMLKDLKDYAKAEGKSALDIDDVKNFFKGEHGVLNLMTANPARRGVMMPSKGPIQAYVGDKVRDTIRANWIGLMEKPSRTAASLLTNALDELEGGYRYTAVVADDLVTGLDGMTKNQKLRAIRDRIPSLMDNGKTYEKQNKDGTWSAVTLDKIGPSAVLNGRVRSREDNLDLLQGQGAALRALRDESRVYRASMFFSRFVEQSPAAKNGRLQLDSAEAPKVVYNLSRAYLPRWHANRVAGAFAAADLAGKMTIYKGLLHTMGEAAGITKKLDGTVDEAGVDWLRKYVDEVDELGGSSRAYSAVDGNDVVREGRRDAIFESQFATDVPLPSFRELHELAVRKGVMSHLGHAITPGWMDIYMEKFWRPGVLIRPALAFRNAFEESGRHMSTFGVGDFIKGQYVRRLMDKQVKQYQKEGFVDEMRGVLPAIGRSVDPETMRHLREVADVDGHLDYIEGMRDSNIRAISNRESGAGVEDWKGERRGARQAEVRFRSVGEYKVMDSTGGDGVRRWEKELQLKLAGSDLGRLALFNIENRAEAVERMTDHIMSPGFQRNREYSRMFRTLIGEADDPAVQRAAAREWAERAFTDTAHLLSKRNGELNTELINDLRIVAPSGRTVLNRQMLNTGRLSKVAETERPRHVVGADLMTIEASPKGLYTRMVEKGYEMTGRLTGVLGKNAIYWANYTDARKTMSDWEQQLVDDYFERLVNQRGLDPVNDPTAAAALKQGLLESQLRRAEEALEDAATRESTNPVTQITREELDEAAKLREEVGALSAQLERVRAGNDPAIAKEIDDMAAKVAKAREDARAQAIGTLTKQALKVAEQRTLLYVDNPDVRSQASVILRNLVPFNRAQEEFYRRVGRTVRYNPEALRKIQLTYEGAEHAGQIEQDEEGNAVFVYPGTRHMQELMHMVGSTFGWNWAMSPVPHRLTSQVRFINQSFDPKNIQPSLGPMAAMPMKAMEWLFPESVALRQGNRVVFGDQAANSGALGSVMPTFVRRVYESGIFGNDTEQLASAMKQSAVYMEVAGRTPPEGADPAVLEDYQDDLRTWSRVHLFMRAIFGTTALAAPSEMGTTAEAPIGPRLENDPAEWMANHRLIDDFRRKYYPTIESEFRGEVQRLNGDYAQALANWIRTRPNELPFTVGKSESEFGGYVPATEQAGKFFDENRELFRQFPAAAILFLPQTKGEFDMDVYRAQMGSEMRRRKDFLPFARDLKLVGNLQTYYDAKEKYATAAAEARARGDSAAARDIDDRWQAAAKVFKASHPAVGSYLSDYAGRQKDRDRTMDELQRMIETRNMPSVAGAPYIEKMIEAYRIRQSALAQITGRTDADNALKRQVKSRFTAYAKDLASKDLNADMVYQRLLRGLEDD